MGWLDLLDEAWQLLRVEQVAAMPAHSRTLKRFCPMECRVDVEPTFHERIEAVPPDEARASGYQRASQKRLQ